MLLNRKSILKKQRNVKSIEITLLTRQLATIISAGIPIVQALEILITGQVKLSLQQVLKNIKHDIENGKSLSDALAKRPDYFNPLFCNIIRAGEQSGALDIMLSRLAQYREKMEFLTGKIKKALFYPVSVVVIALFICIGMLIFIVPQFEQIFKNFGAHLPAPTAFVIYLATEIKAYTFFLLAFVATLIFAFRRTKKRSPAFTYQVDAVILKIPILGKILQKAILARIIRTLATTFAAGMPLVDALFSVAKTAGNTCYQQEVEKLKEKVSRGQQIHMAMKDSTYFPPMVIQMVALGEKSGTLDAMLTKIADFYDEQVDNAVDSLSSLLEPAIMVVLGVMIGGLVIAMYLPIFKLGGVISA